MKAGNLVKILLCLIADETEVITDSGFTRFSFDLYLDNFHVYQAVWSPVFGEKSQSVVAREEMFQACLKVVSCYYMSKKTVCEISFFGQENLVC